VIHSISSEFTAVKQAPENLEYGLGIGNFKKLLGDANIKINMKHKMRGTGSW
jgi:hypothetical protein